MRTGFLREGIIGHGTALHLLEHWVEKPAPGYVFIGPAHLGKRTIAERFVAALLASESASLRAHPDLIILEPEEGKTIVSVELVRNARVRLMERPMVAPRVVCFIPRIDRLNEEGMNALLKVLEEPPAGAVFVTIAEDLSRLPATIQSRVVKVPFSTIPKHEIIEGLQKRGMDEKEATRRADDAHGRPGLAILPSSSEGEKSAARFAEQFMSASSLGERLAVLEAVTKACEAADDPADTWVSVLDAWTCVIQSKLATEPEIALVMGEALMTARRFVGGPLSPRMPFEAAALRMATGKITTHLFPTSVSSSVPKIFRF